MKRARVRAVPRPFSISRFPNIFAILAAIFAIAWTGYPAQAATLYSWDPDPVTAGVQDGSANWTANDPVNHFFNSGGVNSSWNADFSNGVAIGNTSTRHYDSNYTITITNNVLTGSVLFEPNSGTGMYTITSSGSGILSLGGSSFTGGIGVNANAIVSAKIGSAVLPSFSSTNGSKLILSGANTYTDATSLSGIILSIGADNNLGHIQPLTPIAGQLLMSRSTLEINNSFTMDTRRGIQIQNGTSTILVDPNQTLTYGGIIADRGSGQLGLTKSGAGTLLLSGVNTFDGTTKILGGLMNVTGSIAHYGPGATIIGVTPTGTGNSFDALSPELSQSVKPSASYAGYGSTINQGSTGSGFLSDVSILGGSNSSASQSASIAQQWRQRTASEEGGATTLLPDVLRLEGFNNQSSDPNSQTDKFVIQMHFDPSYFTSQDQLLSEAPGTTLANDAANGALDLAWLGSAGAWQNAVNGDFGTENGALANYQGSWLSAGSPLVLVLGSWGVDAQNDVVWAVLNHQGDFSVMVPEPGAIPLLVFAGVGLMARRGSWRGCLLANGPV